MAGESPSSPPRRFRTTESPPPESYAHIPLGYFYVDEGERRMLNHPKWKVGIFKKQFSLRNLAVAGNAHRLLERLIDEFVAQTIRDTERVYGPVDGLSCIINSPLLKDKKAIQVPYRSVEQNTAKAIMNLFESVQQSHWPMDLLSGPIRIDIITVPRRLQQGATTSGSGGKRIDIRQNINMGSLIEVNNADQFCLFYALEFTRLHVTNVGALRGVRMAFERMIGGSTEHYRRQGRQLVRTLLTQLNQFLTAGGEPAIPLNLGEYSVQEYAPLVQRFYDSLYPQMFRITVFSHRDGCKPIWKGEARAQHELSILHWDGHFHGVRNLASLFGTAYYCVDCEAPYDRKSRHSLTCRQRCRGCGEMGFGFPCPSDGGRLDCLACGINFTSISCYDRHRLNDICNTSKRCADCGIRYETRKKHQCGVKYCFTCKDSHPIDERCHVAVLPDNGKPKEYISVIYDIECEIVRLEGEHEGHASGGDMHRVNMVCAYLYCTRCMGDGSWTSATTGDCTLCGPNRQREQYWSAADHAHPFTTFMEWILYSFGWKTKIIALAHYGGRYDMHYVTGDLYTRVGLLPKITKSGEKIYELKVPRKRNAVPEVIFRDTYNWLQLKLESLPAALGLEVESKGWFPYLYNRNENLHTQLDNLPDRRFYNPESMKPEKALDFNHFYYTNAVAKKTPFCLKEALIEYGTSDVRILAHAVVKFRALFMEITGQDVIANSMTIAGACMRYYCTKFLKPKEIAIIPENGYAKMTRQSAKALKFLKWLAHTQRVDIQHRDSVGGEKRYRNFSLDGYVKGSGGCRDTCIEFNGCAWHGHDCLFDDDDLCPNGKTAAKNREELEQRKAQIEEEMDYLGFWECEIDRELRENGNMRDYYASVRDTGPLNPKDAYMGARTGPTGMKCDLEEPLEDGSTLLDQGYGIGNLDIVSLYPYINFFQEYPVGHAEEVVRNEAVHWTRPEHNPFKGIVKCFVVPPKKLRLPVIPQKYNGKLMFVLCHTCTLQATKKAKRFAKGGTFVAPLESCPHSDEERGFVATITHLELNLALEKGYTVTRLYGAYHWEKWSTELFRPYMQQFLKIKTEASGWPDDMKNDPQKQQWYVDQWRELFGVIIDPTNVKKNPGMKLISKICLNCLWGKWSMRNNLSQCLITSSMDELYEVMLDRRLEVASLTHVPHHSDEVRDLMMVTYKKKHDFVTAHRRYNVVLSLFTTAGGRVKLYSYMDRISASPYCRLLYTDTDSVIFRFLLGHCPIEFGDFLGMMSDQYPGYIILAFYCTGPKSYAMKLRHIERRATEYVVKSKGLTLNQEALKDVNFDSIKEMVDRYGDGTTLRVKARVFRPDSVRGQVVTKELEKSFKIVNDKCMVDAQLNCFPFGYVDESVISSRH